MSTPTADDLQRIVKRLSEAKLAIAANQRAKAHVSSPILRRHCDQRIAAARAQFERDIAEANVLIANIEASPILLDSPKDELHADAQEGLRSAIKRYLEVISLISRPS